MFPAFEGDCFLITFTEPDYRILVDGGIKATFGSSLEPALRKLEKAGKGIDLLVVTHVDNDHILGMIELFRALNSLKLRIEIREIWYNSYRHLFFGKKQSISEIQERIIADEVGKMEPSLPKNCMKQEIGYSQGETLAEYLESGWEKVWNQRFGGRAVGCGNGVTELRHPNLTAVLLNPGEAELNGLERSWSNFRRRKYLPLKNGNSPMYEQTFERFLTYRGADITNDSSIAFMLKYADTTGKVYNLLFLGDAPAEICLNRLDGWKNIRFDCVKLPHHGSKKSIREETIRKLNADYILCSTNGRKYGHPDWEVISTVASIENCEILVFNYKNSSFSERISREYPLKKVIYGENGYCKLII